MKRNLTIIGILLCILYLLNPTAGIFELLPDNLPVIGNLDEGAAGALLITLIQSLRSGSTSKSAPLYKQQQQRLP